MVELGSLIASENIDKPRQYLEFAKLHGSAVLTNKQKGTHGLSLSITEICETSMSDHLPVLLTLSVTFNGACISNALQSLSIKVHTSTAVYFSTVCW